MGTSAALLTRGSWQKAPTRFLLLALFGFLFSLDGPVALAPAAETPSKITMSDLTRAWKARHTTIRSGRIEWTESRWIRKGSHSMGMGMSDEGPIPPEDTTFTYTNELTFDGGRAHYRRTGPTRNLKTKKYEESDRVAVWDGKVASTLDSSSGYPHGQLNDFSMELPEPTLFPFCAAFRMLHPQWYAPPMKDFVIREGREDIDGHSCVVLETAPRILDDLVKRGRRPWKESYWVSPEQDYVVVRHESSLASAKPATQFAISYEHDPQHGWYPAKWTRTVGSERLSDLWEGRTTAYALNQPVDAKLFDTTLPEGTWVQDHRSKESYIIQAGGVKRLVSDGELVRGATYEQLLVTGPGMAATAKINRGFRPWLVWGGIGLGILLVGVAFLRKKASD